MPDTIRHLDSCRRQFRAVLGAAITRSNVMPDLIRHLDVPLGENVQGIWKKGSAPFINEQFDYGIQYSLKRLIELDTAEGV